MEPRGCDSTWRVVSVVIVTLCMSVVPASAAAQGPSLAALRIGVTRPQSADTLVPRLVNSGSSGGRVVLGVLGAYLGSMGGATLAARVLTPTQCGDDPGLCERFKGALVGGMLGAAFGAALPPGTGACRFASRAPRALLGASAGYLVGFVVSGDPFSGVLLGGPIGGGVGGMIGARRCRVR